MRAASCIGCLVALVAAMPAALAARACELEPAKLRFDDGYGCFRDPENREGFPGKFKFIPLTEDEQVFLSLGGEVRQRYEYIRDPFFGADPQDDAGVWLQRYTLHGDLHLGPHLRVFGQLSSALVTGRAGGPSPVDQNELALQNAFVDLNLPLGPDADLTLRGGRQELQFGSGRLVDVREGPNVRRTFDAARATVELPGWRVDALAARPRQPHSGVFDDEADDDQALWGVYAVGGADWLPFGALDLYYLGFENDAGTFAHAHGPTRAEIEAPLSLRTLAGLILSVGLRPCSGAVIVLLAAHAMGLRWAGIGAVLAMSLGTGLAVCLLATLSVYARKASLRLAAMLPDRATRMATAIDVVGVIGGAIILAAGLLLLQAAWTTPAHPLR